MTSEACLPAPSSPNAVGTAPHYVAHHVLGRIRHRAHPDTFHAVARNITHGGCAKGVPIPGQPGGLPAMPAGRGMLAPVKAAMVKAVASGSLLSKGAAVIAAAAFATSLSPLSPFSHAAQPPSVTPSPAPNPAPTPQPPAPLQPISAPAGPVAPPNQTRPLVPLDPGPPNATPQAPPSPLPATPPSTVKNGPPAQTVGTAKGNGTPVPEPSSAAILAMAAGAAAAARLLHRRGRA